MTGPFAAPDPLASVLMQRPSASMTKVPFTASAWARGLPRVRAFVDETGDRGPGGTASPIFGMAAVIVDEVAEPAARAVLRQLRAEFRVPSGRPMSWKQDLKTHARRVHAAEALAEVEGLTVIYVVADKAQLRAGSYRDDVTLFYNVIAYATLQRVLWAASHRRGGPYQVEVRYGHVAKHDPTDTHNYFTIKSRSDYRVPFKLLSHLDWVGAGQFEMSQVADLYAGFLKAAVWPEDYGVLEGRYLRTVWPQIRNSHDCVLTLGLQYRPSSALVRDLPWWPCAECKSTY